MRATQGYVPHATAWLAQQKIQESIHDTQLQKHMNTLLQYSFASWILFCIFTESREDKPSNT